MVHGLLNRSRNERGATIIIVTIALSLFMGLVALVVDMGNTRQIRRREQNAADASSLAGARELTIAGSAAIAKQIAAEYAQANMFYTAPPAITTAACPADVTDPNSTCYAIGEVEVVVTTPYTKPGSSVASERLIRVRVCRDVDTPFGAVLGIPTTRPCAAAAAGVSVPRAVGRGVIVLDPDDPASLLKEGDATLTVNNGDVIVDSTAAGGLQCNSANGGIFTTGGGQTLVSGPSTAGQDCVDPDPLLSQPPEPDPLAGLATPQTIGLPRHTQANACSALTLSPGIYEQPCVVDGNQNRTMNPGVYIFQGGFQCQGATKVVSGSDVMFYIGHGDDDGDGDDDGIYTTGTGDTSVSSPKFITKGSCVANLSAPSSGPYESVLIFQARGNENTSQIEGNGSSLTGTIYIRDGTLRIAGAGTLLLDDSMVVVNKFNIAGQGTFTLNTHEPPQATPREAEVSLEG